MKNPQKVITIEAVSDKPENKKAGIKDTNGIWYDIWKDYQGEATLEYNQLLFGNHNQAFKKGDAVIVTYKEDEYMGKVKYVVKSIFPADGNGLPSQAEKPVTVANNASQRESSEAFGLRLAIHGMVNGMLASGATPEAVESSLPQLFKLEKAIDERLNKPASLNVAEAKIQANTQDAPLPEELPTQQEIDVEQMVEDIPFN